MTALPFDNSYTRLPERFYARRPATPVEAPRLIHLNRALADELGLDADWLAGPDGVAALAGNTVPDGADPIAAAYAGHQFGQFVPQLGDGRAVLLGEVIDRTGIRHDIQLKGSGPTPFSRRGDGRAALGPVLREYLVSEAMAALGIPTTRALAAVATGEPVVRETPLPGAVLTRVAASHIRVGTFQFFAARGDVEGLRALADHVVARHYPTAAEAANPYRALLDAVIAAQARLVARWLLVGFVHGVMNTDNMAVAGETIDYGPCAFLDAYDPGTVFSSIDQNGRYAYGQQPRIALWNLTRFAETLLPLLADAEEQAVREAEAALSGYAPAFEDAYHGGLNRKIGLGPVRDGDPALAGDLLKRMAENQADFTLTFRTLCGAVEGDGAVRDLFVDPTAYDDWAVRWQARLDEEARDPAETAAAMRAVNPAFIPRNHQVEAMIAAAVERNDFAPFETLLAVLARPYADQSEYARYAQAPEDGGVGYRTFCGT
ncbi:YdiU family protein [Methylobacterium sp. E-065]|uniref:protein adenylyltransferase SelO n=1 Tax=Methylobacterium sp. E-065 TaxID=2836583 RepID=UPI001FB909E9|nr:YdiU family protein [Methylobacterium sp. E-065]MCJ2020232.1 YdiU family protein [Methylobacterium sp. E-065]